MRKREDLGISRHTINLIRGDYPKLQRFYGTRIGAAKVIRDIVHAHVRKIEEDAAQRFPLVQDLGVDVELEEMQYE